MRGAGAVGGGGCGWGAGGECTIKVPERSLTCHTLQIKRV